MRLLSLDRTPSPSIDTVDENLPNWGNSLNCKRSFPYPTKHLLLIDRETDRRYVTQIGLELTTDWIIWTAHSYREGFVLACNQNPHVILINLEPLDANPLAIVDCLQSHPATRHIPIILTYDRLRFADRKNFARLGVAGAIAQPYDCVSLGEQIATFLNW